MKINIEEIEGFGETEITIKCQSISKEILDFINEYKLIDNRLWGSLDKQSYILNPMDIYYIETIDNKVFAYTKNKVYELSHKLYVLETILPTKYFFRASKSMIINISKIVSIKSLFNGKMQANLDNNESVIISRSNVVLFKEKLGVGK
ncbi:LytTR family DNA-binding domain-containing protein [Clostridium cuniculi]|uniref:LytTR family DNA-binding domain-containing protein n=1 Tax=Clostridium cuniculi TaxID=2548455 RepID=UPI0010556DDF|nr:LytTR family DNA-binding domain-containing protein [Clostridium cuniculi]